MQGFEGITSGPWTNRTKRTVAVLLVVVLGVFAWRLSDMWPPLVVSLVLAYLLAPLVNTFERRIRFGSAGLRRSLATVLAFLLTILIIVLMVLILVPAVAQQLRQFGDGLPALGHQIETGLTQFLSTEIHIGGQVIVPMEMLQRQFGGDPNQPIDLGALLDGIDVVGIVRSFLGPLTTPVLGALGSAFSALLTTIFVLTMTFYLMKDGPRFIERIEVLVPHSYRADVHYLFTRLGGVWNAYLRGQVILCIAMGVAGFLSATILGLPSPLILGLINGILEFVPNLGPALALVPATLFALFFPSATIPGLQGVIFAIVIILVWTGLQNLEAIVLVPRIMGGNLDLHPFVVIVAVIGGAALAGALGVILAAPVVASLRVVGEYLYTKLFDQPPDWESRLPGEAPANPCPESAVPAEMDAVGQVVAAERNQP
ncbi:MAG: AI-2E family transporter [Anaerolineae bacterium]|nr:AI-2E family transporter [Anaerolineae bacterium]